MTPKPPIDGKFLALREDIDDPKEAPTVITFNDTILTISDVMAPTMDQFIEKMEKKDDRNDDSMWFKQANVSTTMVEVAQICPIPAVYAYDALMEAISAYILWERIKVADLQAHVQATHTDHNASNVATVDMGAPNPFMGRQHKDAKQWAKEKAARIFETVQVAGMVAAAMPASPGGAAQAPQDFQKIAEAMIALQAAGSSQRTTGSVAVMADTDATLYKTYGLYPLDMDRMLTMCSLKSGQEDRLPNWITTVAMANLSKDGRRTAVQTTLLADPKYDEHPILITPQLLKMRMDT